MGSDSEINSFSVNVPVGINLHDTFSSAEDINIKLSQLCKEKSVQLYIRDSRTIESAIKKKIKRYMDPNLKFYQIRYACVHGGLNFKCRGTGQRNKKTLKKHDPCPAFILFTISKSGNGFEVTNMNNSHNHRVVAELFKQLPQNRKLPEDIKQDALKLRRLKANKHLIREEIEAKTNQHVTLKVKDLSNLTNNDRMIYSNNIKSACEKINNKYGADCHLLVDTNNIFKGLMFSTKEMKSAFQAYPEFVCIDARYKLRKINAPVYILFIEDGNGESQIVGVGILIHEDKESLRWFLDTFKQINSQWEEVKNIMVDKDLNEREMLKMCFPQASVQICIFHVFKIFQREITCEKMKISAVEKQFALQYLQQLVYSKSEKEFTTNLEEMKNKLSNTILNYLEEHWISIKEEWCPRLGKKVCNFLNTTNNRLEAVINKHSSVEEFLDGFFVAIETLEQEKDSRVAEFLNKRSVVSYPKEQPEYKYQHLLTDYAFKKILAQISNLKKVKTSFEENIYITKTSSDAEYRTEIDTCSCYFFNSMNLPCKHIFKVRQQLQINLFDERLCHTRWTLNYFLANQRMFIPKEMNQNLGENISTVLISSQPDKKNRILSEQEKYKKAFLKCKIIASLTAESVGDNFTNTLNFFDVIIKCLTNREYKSLVLKETTEQQPITETTSNNDYELQNYGQKKNTHDKELLVEEISDDAAQRENDLAVQNIDVLDYYDSHNNAISTFATEVIVVSNGPEKVIQNNNFNYESDHDHSCGLTDATDSMNNIDSSLIKIRPVIKKRGHPSGSDLTVIGLKKKRVDDVLPFEKRAKSEKQNLLFKFVLKDIESVYNKKILDIEDLLSEEQIDPRIAFVNLTIIKQFFSQDSWNLLIKLKNKKKEFGLWICNICHELLSKTDPSIQCDFCLHWVHLNNCSGSSPLFNNIFRCTKC